MTVNVTDRNIWIRFRSLRLLGERREIQTTLMLDSLDSDRSAGSCAPHILSYNFQLQGSYQRSSRTSNASCYSDTDGERFDLRENDGDTAKKIVELVTVLQFVTPVLPIV
mgnify:CR=1 FL=1